jgi:hypothetical protein
MTNGIVIYSTDYSGQTASITYNPTSGGVISLGDHVIPYFYETTDYIGTYDLFFTIDGGKTCIMVVTE